MRIMVLGAGGFIGRHIMSSLLEAGHELVGVARNLENLPEAFPDVEFQQIDLATAIEEQPWHARLEGVDCIVNAAGVLRGRQIEAVHVDFPKAMHAAAAKVGVKQVVLISAISAREDVTTDYSITKLAGEADLRASGLGWTVLRPSLVYGDGSYGGTSLMRGMAGLPLITPVPAKGNFTFTPIHVRDVARSVAAICGDERFHGQSLEPVGPETYSLSDLLARYRAWLGFGRSKFLSIPMPIMRAFARIGDVIGSGPISSNSLSQLVAGNAGDSAAYAKAIGFEPRRLDDALSSRPAQVQDRWHARLFFLAPAITAVLIVLWLASAWLGMFHGKEAATQIVNGLGLPSAMIEPLRIGGSLADVAIAILVFMDKRARWSTIVQMVFVLGYTVTITMASPELWLDPLGPLLKNLPILMLIAVHGAIRDDR
jgi:uncharacterized protein YbjT (DUF2867 family)